MVQFRGFRLFTISGRLLRIAAGDLHCAPQTDQTKDDNDRLDGPDPGSRIHTPETGKGSRGIQQGFIEYREPDPFIFTAGNAIKDSDAGKNVCKYDRKTFDHRRQTHDQRGIGCQISQGRNRQHIRRENANQCRTQCGQSQEQCFNCSESDPKNQCLVPGGFAPPDFPQNEIRQSNFENAG